MRRLWAALAVLILTTAARADDSVVLSASQSQVWNQGPVSVARLHGPVKIDWARRTFTADDAVAWITTLAGETHHVELVLLGHVNVKQAWGEINYESLRVDQDVTGAIRLEGDRVTESAETSDVYRRAAEIRSAAHRPTTTTGPTTVGTSLATTSPDSRPTSAPSLPPLEQFPGYTPPPPPPTTVPAGPVTSTPPPKRSIEFELTEFTRETTSDGNLAAVFTNRFTLTYTTEGGDLMEFVAKSAVVFTNAKTVKELMTGGKNALADHVVSAYFEGDVQVYTTPAGAGRNELRMRAERVFYEFGTDRAVMKDVVLHTFDAKKGVAIFMRASTVRQLSQGEFKSENVVLTSSAFATPTYSLNASNAYVRAEDSGDPALGERVAFQADNVTLNAFGIPAFYYPSMGGTMTARGSAFREVGVNDSNQFGFEAKTKWGLFESLGQIPPRDMNADFDLDYFSKRGPATGIDAKYVGGWVSDTTRQPSNYGGDLRAYFVDDRGVDVLGAARADEKAPEEFRGRVGFEHQQFFGTDFVGQLRLGWVSDSNFMPQWFNDEYQNNLPLDESIYLKRQTDTQVVSFLAEFQPNRAVSTAGETQENRIVSRLPEVVFDRVGDTLWDDRVTVFSENSVAGLKFVRATQSLAQQGFYGPVQPGIASFAYTGDPGRTIGRGDSRQEVDLPVQLGPVKIVPYVFGRYTVYSGGVANPLPPTTPRTVPTNVRFSGDENRLMGGAGVRASTDFWRVDDSIQSDIFDIHRLRHVISPEVNVFASAQNVDQNRLFVFDQNDNINDIEAVQVALRQRWQTKRGGPGRWRNVDVLSVDVSLNLFTNQPEPRVRQPVGFRGLFFADTPETSIARNGVNGSAQWRISDSTAVLADVEHNLDRQRLATASVGVAVQRDERLNYFVGTRYIADLESNIATIEVNYALDRKYTIALTQSFDFAQSKDVNYSFQLIRKFDNFQASVRVYYDQATNDKGFGFNLQPFGLGRGVGTSSQLLAQ